MSFVAPQWAHASRNAAPITVVDREFKAGTSAEVIYASKFYVTLLIMEVQRPLLNLRTKLRMDNGKPVEEKATTVATPSTSSENRMSWSKWLKIGML